MILKTVMKDIMPALIAKANERLKLNLKINHPVWSKDCPVYCRKIEQENRMVNFLD